MNVARRSVEVDVAHVDVVVVQRVPPVPARDFAQVDTLELQLSSVLPVIAIEPFALS